jgi:hydrogenase maturation factor
MASGTAAGAAGSQPLSRQAELRSGSCRRRWPRPWLDRINRPEIDIHVLRDSTRGGVTSALTEIAQSARGGILLNEASIPINEEVKGACEILGLAPLYVVNEGNC